MPPNKTRRLTRPWNSRFRNSANLGNSGFPLSTFKDDWRYARVGDLGYPPVGVIGDFATTIIAKKPQVFSFL